MAKDTFYFSHDYNARSDDKIKRLLAKHSNEGYGIFWSLIEDLYNNTNVLRLDYETFAFDLRCDISKVKSIINDFDLFVIEGEIFGSTSVQSRLEERNAKSKKARESVLKRWERGKSHTNVLPTNNDSNTESSNRNTIKESKGKESKEIKEKVLGDKSPPKTIEEREKDFKDLLRPYVTEFTKETVQAFFDYWTEKSSGARKMRFEKQEVFEIPKRLATWKKKEIEFKEKNNGYDKNSNSGNNSTIKPAATGRSFFGVKKPD